MKTIIKFLPIIVASLLVFSPGCDNDDDFPNTNCIDGKGIVVTETINL